MTRDERIKIFKKFAQNSAPAATLPKAQVFNIQNFPGFKMDLFKEKPNMIGYLNKLVNTISGNIYSLTNGQFDFTMVYTSPGESPSAFTNDAKQLVFLAKWLYNVMTTNQVSYYTTDGLKKFATDLIKTVQAKSFIDPNLSANLIQQGQQILTALG